MQQTCRAAEGHNETKDRRRSSRVGVMMEEAVAIHETSRLFIVTAVLSLLPGGKSSIHFMLCIALVNIRVGGTHTAAWFANRGAM